MQPTNELCQIHGISPKKAKQLVEIHNIHTLEELRKRQDLLNTQQKFGLKYFEDMGKRFTFFLPFLSPSFFLVHKTTQRKKNKKNENCVCRIPREEVEMIANLVREIIHEKVDKNIQIDPCGSFRLGKPTCGDVDLLVTSPSLTSKKQCQDALSKVVKTLKLQFKSLSL